MKYGYIVLTVLLLAAFSNAGHREYDLEKISTAINENSYQLPPMLRQFLGNERINLYLEDVTIGIVTSYGNVTGYQKTPLANPTFEMHTSTNTIRQMAYGNLTFDTAKQKGLLRYEAIDPVTKIKVIIAEIAYSVFGTWLKSS